MNAVSPINTPWLSQLSTSSKFLIAGPCSAETKTQVLDIAHQLKAMEVKVMRAGIWKPRTRPGNFEGVGAIGLDWLQQAKKETGLKTAIEVANKTHVELALKADIDIFWVGARSAVSPFIVQEIADALRGTNKIVFVKNPVNPDLALWIGAIERFKQANINYLGAIHRGFSSYEKSLYRNNPEWQVAIDLKAAIPSLPLLVDPSHIGGKRELIFDLTQTAMNLNYDGMMIETHPTPTKAWSDADQQITPKQLSSLLKQLKYRVTDKDEKNFQADLSYFRDKIDVLDQQIINSLGKRMKVAEEAGQLKGKNNVSVLQPERWKNVLNNLIKQGKAIDLSEEFVSKLVKAIHQESITRQSQIIQSDETNSN